MRVVAPFFRDKLEMMSKGTLLILLGEVHVARCQLANFPLLHSLIPTPPPTITTPFYSVCKCVFWCYCFIKSTQTFGLVYIMFRYMQWSKLEEMATCCLIWELNLFSNYRKNSSMVQVRIPWDIWIHEIWQSWLENCIIVYVCTYIYVWV